MTNVLITDHDFLDHSIEQGTFDAAGIAVAAGQLRTEDELNQGAGRGDAAAIG